MDKAINLLLPASLAYLGVKGAEMLGQKGAIGALAGIAGAFVGLIAANKVAGVVGAKKAIAPAAAPV